MTQTLPHLLEQIAAEEAAVHAAADVARTLLTEHPDLPVEGARIKTYNGFEIHLKMPDAATVHAWAERLSLGMTAPVPVKRTVYEAAGSYVYEHVDANATAHGHRIHLHFCRILPEDQAATWRATQPARTETTS